VGTGSAQKDATNTAPDRSIAIEAFAFDRWPGGGFF
jgi:hypothetical protein